MGIPGPNPISAAHLHACSDFCCAGVLHWDQSVCFGGFRLPIPGSFYPDSAGSQELPPFTLVGAAAYSGCNVRGDPTLRAEALWHCAEHSQRLLSTVKPIEPDPSPMDPAQHPSLGLLVPRHRIFLPSDYLLIAGGRPDAPSRGITGITECPGPSGLPCSPACTAPHLHHDRPLPAWGGTVFAVFSLPWSMPSGFAIPRS